jgi:CheY-like chemotaxis protein
MVARRSPWPRRNQAPQFDFQKVFLKNHEISLCPNTSYGKYSAACRALWSPGTQIALGSALPRNSEAARQLAVPSVMSEKILLVDDDEVLGQVLHRVLSQEGYTVLKSTSLAQALQLDQDHQPQLALLDLCLPDGDGVQLADKLRLQHPGLPLILITAYPVRLRDHPEHATRFVRVLTKPLNVRELRQAMEATLAPAAMETPSPRLAAPASLAISLPREVAASSFFRS